MKTPLLPRRLLLTFNVEVLGEGVVGKMDKDVGVCVCWGGVGRAGNGRCKKGGGGGCS